MKNMIRSRNSLTSAYFKFRLVFISYGLISLMSHFIQCTKNKNKTYFSLIVSGFDHANGFSFYVP